MHTKQIVTERMRGNLVLNAHPVGTARQVQKQIDYVKNNGDFTDMVDFRVLVVGASMGYGIASLITSMWGYGAKAIAVFYDKQPSGKRTANPGYYNLVALHRLVKQDGLFVGSINGDAFSDEVKAQAIELVKRKIGKVNMLIYSIAAPRRTHPRSGVVHQAFIKPIGQPYTTKTIDLNREVITEVTVESATPDEVNQTISVMGGEDLEMWVDRLLAENLLASEPIVLSYSYIGPKITWPIYHTGTIGAAKADFKRRIDELDKKLADRLGGNAYISVNKAIVSQASMAIPGVPLYLSLLDAIMDAKGINEDAIAQMVRLFTEHLKPGQSPTLDAERRIRLDNRELRADVASEVIKRWEILNTDNFRDLSDFDGLKRRYLNLFGFGVEGVNYSEPVETEIYLPQL